MKKIILLLLIFSSLLSYSQESDRRCKFGIRISSPSTKINNLDFNGLIKIRTIGNFFFIQPEIGIPYKKDSINTNINLLIRIKSLEVIGGIQYNYTNKFNSYGLNFGVNKKIVEQLTIGINYYLPNNNLNNLNDYYFLSKFKTSIFSLNIQIRI